jgi:hypothetical protein
MTKTRSTYLGLLAVLLSPMAANAVPIEVIATGFVEYNLIASGPLSTTTPGDAASISFRVDSDIYTDSSFFPTRGYEIDLTSFLFTLGANTVGLDEPKATTSYFVIRDNDPAVDGFFLSENNVDFPFPGPPLDEDGLFGPLTANFVATYTGDLLSSLDILDALGTYTFDGLTVFNFTVGDGPFDAMGLVYESLTISAVNVPEPTTLCLLLAGFLGMGLARRRKKV